MTIAAILRTKGDKVIHATPDMRVGALAALLTEKRIGAVPVLQGDGSVIGIMSERDIVRIVATDGAAALDRPVEEVMTRDLVTATPDTPLLTGLSLMTRRRIRHLPVIANDELVGFVSIGDLVKARIDRIESEAASLRDYIAG